MPTRTRPVDAVNPGNGINSSISPTPAPTTAKVVPGRHAAAARRVSAQELTPVDVPFLGRVHFPHPQQLAFLAGIGVLAVVGVVEWPVALITGAGHTLASQSKSRLLQAFGEALDEA